MVRNVHERFIAAPTEQVGALLDTLGSAGDRLWPEPPLAPMVLRYDGGTGLAVGADGGHGAIRYSVAAWEPGRSVTFRFAPRLGIRGTHSFTVDGDGDGTRLRHELVGELEGAMRVLWPLCVRSMHDCYCEDAFDRAERELGVGPAVPHRHSRWVRIFERRVIRRVTPGETNLAGLDAVLPRIDAADTFRVDMLPGDGADPVEWFDAIFAAVPWWVNALMRLRNALVRPFGLKTDGGGSRPFPLLEHGNTHALLGVDDKHLDFRVVISVDERKRSVSLTTVVQINSRLGRLYWAVVRHFHPRVVRALMRRTVHPVGSERLVVVPDARSAREQLSEQA